MESADEYYDSLDEDSNYGSLDNDSVKEEPVTCQNSDTEEHTSQPYQDLPDNEEIGPPEDEPNNDDIIPYYEKELNRSAIELSRVNSKSNKSSDNKSTKEMCRRQSNASPFIESQKFSSKSYLNIFQAKVENECLKNKLSVDSSSVICLNSTPKSFVTCQDFDVNSSVYHISEDFSENGSSIDVPFDNDKQDCLSTITSLESKLCSVSEQCLNVGGGETRKSKRNPKSFNKVPELGGLGPDIKKDKLELLKKRQMYGQRVNQKNRIKMIEKKLLDNLQKEMKECNNVNFV